MRGILTITYLPVSQFAQNDTTNDEIARLSFLIGILSPDSGRPLIPERVDAWLHPLGAFDDGLNQFRPVRACGA